MNKMIGGSVFFFWVSVPIPHLVLFLSHLSISP